MAATLEMRATRNGKYELLGRESIQLDTDNGGNLPVAIPRGSKDKRKIYIDATRDGVHQLELRFLRLRKEARPRRTLTLIPDGAKRVYYPNFHYKGRNGSLVPYYGKPEFIY